MDLTAIRRWVRSRQASPWRHGHRSTSSWNDAGPIHHGGFGTSLSAARLALPQLLIPLGADQHWNAAALGRRGAAHVVAPSALDDERMRDWLHDLSVRTAATELSEEMGAMPSPAEVADRVAGLAGG
jgi:UDP:flavonoid glycosyltransferase YjiC (YdhE family)